MKRLKPARIVLLAIIVTAVAVFCWHRGAATLEALHAWAARMDGSVLFLALATLPLVGFPVSILHAVSGAKYGFALGLLLVGLSIALQLAASYTIVALAPGFFARRFDRLRQRLPPATHRALTIFTMLLPGAPYFAQNYVLAVAGVPFGIFFLYSFPSHLVRSVVGLVFGEWSGHMTPGRVLLFVGYSVVITTVCALAFRRLRAQLRSPPPAGGGPTPRA